MKNWAGNLTYGARRLLEPRSLEELQSMVAASDRLRPMGTRHSFSAIGDTDGDVISVARLPRRLELDEAARTVTVDGAMTYADLGPALHAQGFALDNLPSLPHVTIAGACATGTHGSGDRSAVLSAATTGLELVLADGSLRRVGGDGGDVPLAAAAVSLGALGIVAAITLSVEPAYDVRQDVFEHLPAAAFEDAIESAHELADSASFFTTWRDERIDQVWLKRRLPGRGEAPLPRTFFGATAAVRDLHPIRAMPGNRATPQLGVRGPWHERVAHFRASHIPSSGKELQGEYFVARSDVGPAFRALLGLRDVIGPLVQVSEIRSIALDDLWLSPASGRASAAFHFTWVPDEPAVMAALARVEETLAPFEPRAHWAKLTAGARHPGSSYPRLPEFAALSARLDPGRKLRNAYLDRVLEPVRFGTGRP